MASSQQILELDAINWKLKQGDTNAQCHLQLKDSANSAQLIVWRMRYISYLNAKSTHFLREVLYREVITMDNFTLLPH